jgi:hypothetical protein
MKKLFFDMDGTVADLYNSSNWLEKIQKEESGVFCDLQPLFNIQQMSETCLDLISRGWQIGIITWLPMNASDEYMEICAKEKKEWVEKNMPYVSEFYPLPYGTPKQHAGFKKAQLMVLVDDNAEVVRMWETVTQRVGIQVLPEYYEMPFATLLENL